MMASFLVQDSVLTCEVDEGLNAPSSYWWTAETQDMDPKIM